MAKKPETKFKEKILPAIQALPRTWYVKTNERSVRGIPDLLLCVRGHFLALELKVPPNSIDDDELQKYTLSKIRAAGGLALEVTPQNWDVTYKILIELATGKRVLVQEPIDEGRSTKADH